MKRANKITKNANFPLCPYCNHPNDVFHFNLHKEGEPINASCEGCGAEYQWIRYVVELYVSDTMPEPPVFKIIGEPATLEEIEQGLRQQPGIVVTGLPGEEIK